MLFAERMVSLMLLAPRLTPGRPGRDQASQVGEKPGGKLKVAPIGPYHHTARALTCDRNCIRYPYPLFEMLSPLKRGAVFAGSAILMTISSIMLSFVYRRANGHTLSPESRPGAVVGR